MTTLPPATDFTGAAVTEGQFKTAITSLRDYLSQLLGDDSTVRAGDDLIINGAMNIARRGVSFTGVGGAAKLYTLDRWLIYTIGSPQGRATITQESGVFADFGSSVKIDTTTAEVAVAAGEVWAWQQRIEAQNLQHLKYGNAGAKSLVCTFNIKSPKSGTHCIALYQPDATRSFIKEFTVASANTEEEITVVFTGDASGTINDDVGEGLRLTWPLIAGSTFQVVANTWAAGEDYATANQQNLLDNTANNFEITGVRLRLGVVATANPFVHRAFGEELVLAQRYYERINFDESSAQQITVGFCQTTNDLAIIIPWNVKKRSQPTSAESAADTFQIINQSGSSIVAELCNAQTSIGYSTYYKALFGKSTTNMTIGESGILRRDGTDAAWVEGDAEL